MWRNFLGQNGSYGDWLTHQPLGDDNVVLGERGGGENFLLSSEQMNEYTDAKMRTKVLMNERTEKYF